MSAWVNSCVKNIILPHSLALLKTLVVQRWLMWPMLLTTKDDTNLRRNVTVARKLGTLQNIVARNSTTIARRKVHIIKDYRVRPQNRFTPTFHTLFTPPLCLHLPLSLLFQGSSSNLTSEQVQQMIVFALSVLGLQGKKRLLPSPWLIDSTASNHMTGSLAALHDVRSMMVQIFESLMAGFPIIAVGNQGSSFTNVFVSPDLSANLISVGQLVEENHSPHFDRSGYRVQDQVSRLEIAKGPKVGRLFPL
ncbi:hypothetical protein Patl1_22301 [Pistacia atlantica]|uniref:Uncharacterized protein n=1 Tax=Pistacia atlantica TaxID=434234 RepID=A0ACC0ZZG2_9ROSI|nr:hypothetical protein Patl1_22301 [Pistacia atlantica]